MIRIVGIGGGTGLPVWLEGLRDLAEPSLDITAIVCVSDNGGSSGRLRQALGIPAVGDLRNCLVALSGDERFSELFQYRFASGNGLKGHALGNLIMAAACEKAGGLRPGVDAVAQLLHPCGRVLPVTAGDVTLCAEFDDGAFARGECEIAASRSTIRRIWLEPGRTPPSPGVTDAILAADLIVLGPGSLFTSIAPNLLVDGVAPAIRNSGALKALVCNLMTQPGETEGFSASDHLGLIGSYLGGAVDVCVLNSAPIPGAQRAAHARYGSGFVINDVEQIARAGVAPVCAELLSTAGDRVRHDPMKLARLLVSLVRSRALAPRRAASTAVALR